MKINFALLLLSLVATHSALAADGVSFSNQVASILVDNCVACHGAKKAEGGYRIDTFEYLSKSGDSGRNGGVEMRDFGRFSTRFRRSWGLL